MYKYLVSMLLVILIFLFILAGKTEDTTPRNRAGGPMQAENNLRFDVPYPFLSLSPLDTLNGTTMIFPLMYSYLFVPNYDGQLEPDLATQWTYDPEDFTWTILLRNDALWHDGERVTAEDVRYSLSETIKTHATHLLPLVKEVAVLTDNSLRLALNKDDRRFLHKIGLIEIIPNPSHKGIDLKNNPIGSGPFRFSYRNGKKEIGLIVNEDYYNGRPSIERIIYYHEVDKQKSWERLIIGKTDIAMEIDPRDFNLIKKYNDSFYFDLRNTNYYTILLYNASDPLFSDSDVRTALSYAIDKESMIERLLSRYGVVACSPIGMNSPYHNPNVQPIPYDPGKALKILQEAGWHRETKSDYLYKEGKRFEFTIYTFEEYRLGQQVAEYIQLILGDLGMKVHLQELPGDVLIQKHMQNCSFQSILTEFGATPDMPELLQYMWCPAGNQRSPVCFEDSCTTNLFKQALQEEDTVKRTELFQAIDARIAALQPGTFLFHKIALNVMSKRINYPFPFRVDLGSVHRLRHASIGSRE